MERSGSGKVRTWTQGPARIVEINRPEVRNAVDAETARMLLAAFTEFDGDEAASVAVLTGPADRSAREPISMPCRTSWGSG